MALTSPSPSVSPASRALALVTLALFPLRLYASRVLGFGDAEALYACYALRPQPSYRDHPGLLGALGRALADGGALTPSRVHLAATLALTGLPFLASACAKACGARAERAPIAGFALVAAPEITVGLFGWTPDLPLAFAWIAALGLGGYVFRRGPDAPRATAAYLGLGLALGVACVAKASGALLPLALAATLAAPSQRKHLRRPGPWLAFALCLLVAGPVASYEATHGFPLLRHRFVDTQARAGLSLRNLGAFVGGQLAYVSPPLLAAAGLAARSLFARARAPERDAVDNWLRHATIIPAAFLAALCLWSRVAEPHWFAPALLALPLAEARAPSVSRRLARASVAVGLALSLFVHLWVLTDLAPRFLGGLYVPRYDLANDMLAWPRALPALRDALERRRYDDGSPPVVLTPHWTLAAQVFAGLGPDAAVGTLGGGPDDFRDWLPAERWQGRPWLVWVNDDRRPRSRPSPLDAWAVRESRSVLVERGGRPARRAFIEVLAAPEATPPASLP